MLRASARDEKGRRTLIFGLEPANLRRLEAGQPISLDAGELGVDCNVILFAGGSPEEMARQLGATVMDAKPEGTA